MAVVMVLMASLQVDEKIRDLEDEGLAQPTGYSVSTRLPTLDPTVFSAKDYYRPSGIYPPACNRHARSDTPQAKSSVDYPVVAF